jgi:isoamylase
MNEDILPGKSYPLGATVYPDGVNFSIFSKNAKIIELLLFDKADDTKPRRTITLDRHENRTFYYWHVFIKGLRPGQLYGYRAYGPWDPAKGHRYDPQKILIDPYAKAILTPEKFSRESAMVPGDNCAQALKGAVIADGNYDWEGDLQLNTPFSVSVIYELHVRGFTRHPSSGISEAKRGTYAGLIEKIPYLKSLGITAVELMPVYQFDDQDSPDTLKNYWGYTPVNFFAPHNAYGYEKDPIMLVNEFKDMVKAFHKQGIEVILDVVFNHTAEGGNDGPIYSLKGLENKWYYLLDQRNNSYLDYTGCGNTLNANHSIIRRMIMDSLKYWASEMHVDGFRFDLASVLSRDEYGEPLKNPPILWEIESDPVLANCKIIAEAWDAAGLYQVGSFIGDKWAEWNGRYRDDIRRFVKGDPEMVPKLAARILGSPDIYPDPTREPNRSIHFICCHDGFTLNDLVTYNKKHNQANLEKNKDGSDANYSWNCGVEGQDAPPLVDTVRLRLIKNFFTILFFSQGTPMFLMGDEVRRTQFGNNNAYCQDNDISWFNWVQVSLNWELMEFVKSVIRLTQGLEVFRLENILSTYKRTRHPHLIWHGVKVGKPDWNDWSRTLAFSLNYPQKREFLHVIMNSYWEDLKFELPDLPKGLKWYRIIDTSLIHPEDCLSVENASLLNHNYYTTCARSVVVLMGLLPV